MASQEQFDVLILGGGPAGAVLAERLSHRGYSVAIVERQPLPRYAVGESLPPSVGLLLTRMGIVPDSSMLNFPRTTGYFSAWGTDALSFTPHHAKERTFGFQVDRATFDSLLIQSARDTGATILESYHPIAIAPATCGWQVILESRDGLRRTVVSRFLCDASGRARVLARKLQLKPTISGRLIGMLCYWDEPHSRASADQYDTLVEATPDGWMYTARLQNNHRAVGFMTDRDLLPRDLRHHARAICSRALRETKHVRQLLQACVSPGEVKIFAANPTLIERCCGPDWLLVGDAASTLDPLCSQGVQKAITSALAAATVVHTILSRPERTDIASEFYRERERAGFLAHLDSLRQYYAREQRWKRRPFWKRRMLASHVQSATVASNQTAPAPQDRLIVGSGTSITGRPVIEGEFVELRPVVVPPNMNRGLRFCGSICVPDVLALLDSRPTVEEVLDRYRGSHSDVSRIALQRGIAHLVRLGVIMTEQGERR